MMRRPAVAMHALCRSVAGYSFGSSPRSTSPAVNLPFVCAHAAAWTGKDPGRQTKSIGAGGYL